MVQAHTDKQKDRPTDNMYMQKDGTAGELFYN